MIPHSCRFSGANLNLSATSRIQNFPSFPGLFFYWMRKPSRFYCILYPLISCNFYIHEFKNHHWKFVSTVKVMMAMLMRQYRLDHRHRSMLYRGVHAIQKRFLQAFRDFSFGSVNASCPQTQEECCFLQCYFKWSEDYLFPWAEMECEKGQVTLKLLIIQRVKKCVYYQSLESFLLTSLL